MPPPRRFLASPSFKSRFVLLVLTALAAGCNDGQKDFTCSASQTGGCSFQCDGNDTCTADCQTGTGNCSIACGETSNCTCTGNVCSIECQTSGTCICKASVCNCTGENCQN